ncbi:uncharacterized protein [Cicer arietinum]|uniref:Uncharacterized protein LOC101501288 n=1 Tax=Cicer arietinum TaxID=3827 RepID=A0A1S2Y7I6_CICAR|nr:uncharacterized protein LOC101501288 [Cicer arietinum]
MDRILLRFRPIAPKPGTTTADTFLKSGESTKKHSKYNFAKKRCNRRRKTVPPPAVTLSLLPETPDPTYPISPEANSRNELLPDAPVWLGFESEGHTAASEKVDPAVVALGSVVTVECVTDTWIQGDEACEWLLGSKDEEERKMKLEKDTCPVFISDGYGRVTWRNSAYKEIVGEGGVWLAKVPYPYSYCKGLTCRVRVKYACGKERTVPCDAWRMDSGDFAWRLDVTAALTLSIFPF